MTAALDMRPDLDDDTEPIDAEDTDLDESPDPDAPYGRRPDGRPYKLSPEKRAEMGQRLADARAAAAATGATRPRRRRSGVAAPARKPAAAKTAPAPDYRAALNGLLIQLPSFALGMLGRRDPAFAADAAAVVVHGPPLVDALAETAATNERLAALLDRIAQVGPYGLVVTAAVPMVMQIMCNHRLMPPNPELGVLSPDQLFERLAPGAQAA